VEETAMAIFSRKPVVSFVFVAALLPAVICAATPVGAEVKIETDGDGNAQLDGEGAKDPAGLAGCYDVTGFDTEGEPYSGALCITLLGDLLFELTWTQMEEDEGLVIYNGRGVSVGDDLFAVWSEDGTEYDCYLHLFDIDFGDGTLNGLRVNVNGATSSQTATREGTQTSLDWSESGQLTGSYDLESSEESTGNRLTVTHLPTDNDDAYSFRWSGGTDLEGVGVREDNAVVVVANPVGQMSGTCGSITYTRNKNNRELVGTFYTPDSLRGATSRRRGEETATPRE
jgi:hypothetical protein